ncbi:MAG: alpha/beta fold hydrolase [Acidobacteriota bacterium]|jgi:homoserine O-acetyltransferase|nr:alpha/beta fold hydrolase [Acidobacteriota bacterium]
MRNTADGAARRPWRAAFFFVLALALPGAAPARAGQLFGDIGDLELASGEVLKECRVGYRAYGAPNADKSNVILQPTWANGRTEQMEGGVAGLVAAGFYVITVDALSNGVSSSPSNSRLQPRMRFPKITVRDMVESQHRLLTRVLGITHIKAVMGTSMGGMQAFQWATAYPGFMDKAVALVGSPRLAPYDMLLWQTQIDAIKNDRRWNGGDYTENPATEFEYEIGALILTSPDYYNAHTTREQLFAEIAKSRDAYSGPDANDKIRQAEAMMALDVADDAGKVKAEMFIAVSKTDHTVTPGPALEFARRLGVVPFIYEGDCGHSVHYCQDGGMGAALMKFLAD